jgi:HlyD family secretion protein
MNLPKRFQLGLLLAATLVISACSSAETKPVRTSEAESAVAPPGVVLASPGRVEGRTETLEIGAGVDGVITRVFVTEGQKVARGTKLAELNCSDLEATHRAAIADSEGAKQARARLVRGSRDEERLSAEQRTSAARAILEQAQAHRDRTSRLFESGVVAKAIVDEAERDQEVAEARLEEAIRNEQLVKASPVVEDLAKADADVVATEERVKALEAKLGRCNVEAPISGTVLRVQMRAGEAFSTVTPQPVVTMADLSTRRVRAEIDERDVAKIRVGQPVVVSTDAHQQKFTGIVKSIAPTMGRKKIRSGDPAEKADRDVLEAVIDLNQPEALQLPVGIRVVAQFLP